MSDTHQIAALAAFQDWSRSVGLPGSEADRRRFATAFLGACYADLGKEPRLLEPEDWPLLLGQYLPSRLAHRDSTLKIAGDLLHAWLKHLGERSIVPYAYELASSLEEHLPHFERAIGDPALARRGLGPSKPVVHRAPKHGRNEACFCGSGKKFKQCHGRP
jgi:SEC-C motif